MDPGLIWLLAGLGLLLAELLLPGVFLLWIGLAAIGTGAVVWLASPGFGAAVVVFLVLLAAGIALGLRRRPGSPVRDGAAGVNAPGSGLVGRIGTPIGGAPNDGSGPGLRVRVGDSDWPARLLDDGDPDPPLAIRVEAVEGTTLVVRRVRRERRARGRGEAAADG